MLAVVCFCFLINFDIFLNFELIISFKTHKLLMTVVVIIEWNRI